MLMYDFETPISAASLPPPPIGVEDIGTTSCSGVGSGELRHMGHDALSFSHASTHITWKQWRQSGSIRSISDFLYSDKQIEHTPSSAAAPLFFVKTNFG